MAYPTKAVVGSPTKLEQMNPGDLTPDAMPAATNVSDGHMTADHVAQLEDHETRLDSAEGSITAEAAARAAADTAESNARAAADTTLQANVDAEETARIAADAALQADIDAVDAVASTAVQNGTKLETRPSIVQPVFVDKTGTALRFRGLRPDDGASIVRRGEDLAVIRRAPASWFSADVLNWVRNWSAKGRWWCGGFNTPPNPPHPSSDYPFTCFSILDYTGRPHHFHEWLETTNAGAESGYWGAEDGELVEAGLLAERGRRMIWGGSGSVLCATDADTFIEFVVEPNHAVGVLNGPDRMRFTTRELGVTWTGTLPMRFEIQVVSRGTYLDYGGWIKIGDVFEHEYEGGSLTPTNYDLLADDALFCPRFRIDRIANLDTFDGTYQVNGGTDGVGTEREIEVTNAYFRGEG